LAAWRWKVPGWRALCILVLPGQPELAERLNQIIAELKDEGVMEQKEVSLCVVR